MLPIIETLTRRRGALLFRADFTTQPVGSGSVSSYGLSFSRASSGHSVQTGTSTVATGGSIASNDVPRYGKQLDASPVALVLETSRENIFLNNRSPGSTGWQPASGGTVTSGQTSPDGGSGAYRFQAGSGQFATWLFPSPGTGSWTDSLWRRRGSVGALSQIVYSDSVTVNAVASTSPSVYQRVERTRVYATVAHALIPCDGRDQTVNGGAVAGARDEIIDYIQAELGKFATESIITGASAVTRAGERLWKAVGSTLLTTTGSLRFYVKLRPKGSSSDYASDMRFWHVDVNNHAEVVASTGAVKITIGGTVYTTATAAAWAANDLVEFWLAAGGGSLATVAKYRVNGGSVVTLSTGSPPTQAAITISGACDLLCNGTANQFTSRVEKLEFHPNGSTPTGF